MVHKHILLGWLAIAYSAQIEKVDVIIMGAGMTGISAGHVFANASLNNFIIIEAQDYIGGRTRTIPFGSKETLVNMGASWIAGACIDPNPPDSCYFDGEAPTATNPIVPIALKTNLQRSSTSIHDGEYPPFINGTSTIAPRLVDIEYTKLDFAQICMAPIIRSIDLGLVDDMSVGEGLADCLWRGPLNNIEKTIQWMEFDFELGAGVWEASLWGSGNDVYENYGNQDWFITDPRGYQGVTLELASDYLNLDDLENEPKIALNSPIEHIEYHPDGGVTVHIADSDRVYHSKYGIITFSIGALQSDLVRYTPPWPRWKHDAVQGMMMTHYAAVYIEWPFNFWSSTHPEIDQHKINILVDERYGYFPWFLNLNHDDLVSGSLIWRFDITNELALRVQHQDIESTKHELIRKLEGYFDADIIPEPVNLFVGNWSVNEFVRGAYSGVRAGYDFDRGLEDMRWPLGGVLFFGGEALEGNDWGFVHTAYLDGIRVAKTVLNCLGFPNTEEYPCHGPFVRNGNTTTNFQGHHTELRI